MIWIIWAAAAAAAWGLCLYRKYVEFAGRSDSLPCHGAQAASPYYREYCRQGALAMQQMEGREYEEISIRSDDGYLLRGKLFRSRPENDKLVIAVHGYHGGSLADMARFEEMYRQCGCDALYVSLRVHEDSEGKWITFGSRESLDLIEWCRTMAVLYGREVQIWLHGVSMGASSVIMAAGRQHLPSQVRGIVADSPYDSTEAVLRGILPRHSRMDRAVGFAGRNFCSIIFARTNLKKETPLAMAPGARIPCLFIRGDADQLIPPSCLESLLGAYGGEKECWIVQGATHICAFAKDPDGYQERFSAFVRTTAAQGRRVV